MNSGVLSNDIENNKSQVTRIHLQYQNNANTLSTIARETNPNIN